MKKLYVLLVLMLAVAVQVSAQQKVSGTVTDTGNAPLPGVNVSVAGTQQGTITDFDGNYTIEMPEGANRLTFSFVGYASQTLTVEGSTLDVTMSEGVELDDVVVTALGIKREKKSLGYSTQEVAGDEVTKVKDVNFINSLSGKVAGVDINRSNTMGGSSNVIIRGSASLTGNNQALFVVDGVPVSNANTNSSDQRTGRGGFDFGNAAMDINPEDIESVNVLKGAAATALYGSRASNGVVLITTKKGKQGSKNLGVSVSTGFIAGNIDKTTMPVYQDEYGPGYSAIQGWYAGAADGFDGLEYDDLDGDGTPDLAAAVYEDASYGAAFDPNLQVLDWRSYYPELGMYGEKFPYVAGENTALDFYETSKTWNTNVAVDGGNENGAFRLSMTNFQQTGILPNSEIGRNSVNFSSSYDVTDKLTVSATANYLYQDAKGRYGTGYDARNPNQSFRQWYSTHVDMEDQREAYESTGINASWNPYAMLNPAIATQPHYFDNYYFNAYENYSTDSRNRFWGQMSAEYKINDNFRIMGRFASDRSNDLQEERIAVGAVDVPMYMRYNRTYFENNSELFLYYDNYFGDNELLSVNAMVGGNLRRSQLEDVRAETNGGLVIPGLYSLNNTVSPIEAPEENFDVIKTNSIFGSLTLGLKNMLYLEATLRGDKSSTLPADNNTYLYPAVSTSFIVSELFDSEVVSFAKVRFNYAQIGADAPVYSILNNYALNTPFAGQALASVSNTLNNADLLPERTQSLEAGLEMNFFNNRVGFDLSVYRNNTFDQILPVSVTAATGQLFQYVNAGEVQNQGIEFALNATPIQAGDFSWNLGFNIGANRNKVIELFGDQTNLQLASVQGGISINATVDEPYGAIWGTNYVFHDDGSPIVYPHWNTGVRYQKTVAPEVIGNINPDFTAGVTNGFRYKDISLSFLIDIQKGGDFFSLDTWYGYATGIYDLTAGTNSEGGVVRDLPENGGGIFIDGAVVQASDADGNLLTDDAGNPISDGTANTEAFYASDVYSSLGYVYAPNAYHVYDASFVKLRELSIGYSLPANLGFFQNTPFAGIDISLVGRNLWIIHKNTPYSDPEAGLSAGNIQGYQSGAYPSVRELGFNVKVSF